MKTCYYCFKEIEPQNDICDECMNRKSDDYLDKTESYEKERKKREEFEANLYC